MKTSILLQFFLILSIFFGTKVNGQNSLTISGPTVVCDNVSTNYVKYQVDSASGNYNWSLPQGMTIVSGQGAHKIIVDIDYSFINGQVSVTKTNDSGNLVSSSLNVDILPELPIFRHITRYVLADRIVSYSVENTGLSYTWTAPYGSVIIEGQNTSTVKIKFSQSFVGGDVEVIAENNCGVSATSKCRVDIQPEYSNESLALSKDTKNNLQLRVLVADIAFHDNLTGATFRDTVKRGDDYYFEVVLQNYSQNPMDTFYMKYYFSSNPNSFIQKIVNPLDGGEATTLPVLIIPTNNLSGANELVIELNPSRIVPETDYTNNTLAVPFFVKDDVISSNEMLGVSGVEMMNFPNPAVSMTTFSVKLDKDYTNVDIEVYDINGRIVKTLQSIGTGKEFRVSTDITDLSNGVYYWRVIADGTTFNSKNVIKVSR